MSDPMSDPASRPTVALTIAGSDPSGGAGIQADLKTFSALGAYGTSVVTALTAQSTQGVTGVHPVPVGFVREQWRTLLSDVQVDAIGRLCRCRRWRYASTTGPARAASASAHGCASVIGHLRARPRSRRAAADRRPSARAPAPS